MNNLISRRNIASTGNLESLGDRFDAFDQLSGHLRVE
jgi:hypothetical protein